MSSPRICIDVVACQTSGSRHRGIGNYTAGLLEALLKLLKGNGEAFLVGIKDMESLKEISDLANGRIPDHRIRAIEMPGKGVPEDPASSPIPHMQAASLARAYSRTTPDIVHVSSLFETSIHIPPPRLCPGMIKSTVIYDFIPYIFKDRYLTDDVICRWYDTRIAALRQYDLQFSISESTKRDAINHLGMDPERIVTVLGACDSQFKPFRYHDDEIRMLWARYGITRPFLMYTGGIDWRKNIEGAIQAYARLPKGTRDGHCFAVVCKILEPERTMLRQVAEKSGLAQHELILTGFVPDVDLVGLYRTCKAFIFPSIYEGMGLPILEAISCGAPTIVGNNSSLPEMMPLREAHFDSNDLSSITPVLDRVLSNNDFRGRLIDFGIRHAKTFTWEKTVRLIIERWKNLLEHKNAVNRTSMAAPRIRSKLAFCTPLPPEQTGIAFFSVELILELKPYYEIEIFTTASDVSDLKIFENHPVHALQRLDELAPSFDLILYQFGNSSFHAPMIDLLKRWPGIVELHDFFLSGLVNYAGTEFFREEVRYSHGEEPYRRTLDDHSILNSINEFPVNRFIFEHSMGVIVHSQYALDLCKKFYPEGVPVPVKIIPHIKRVSPGGGETRNARARVPSHPEKEFVICAFGHIAITKAPGTLIDAFEHFMERHPRANARLIFAGAISKDSFSSQLLDRINASKYSKAITITGFLSGAEYQKWLSLCDIGVQLRQNSRGETSGAVLDCLAEGIPTIVNRYAGFCEYPDDAVFFISEAPSAAGLADAIGRLFIDKELRSSIGCRAVEHVVKAHSPAMLAADYYRTMQEMLQDGSGRNMRLLIKYMKSMGASETDIKGCLRGMAVSDQSPVNSPGGTPL